MSTADDVFDVREPQQLTRLLIAARASAGKPVESFMFWDSIPENSRDEATRAWQEGQAEREAHPGDTFMPTNT